MKKIQDHFYASGEEDYVFVDDDDEDNDDDDT